MDNLNQEKINEYNSEPVFYCTKCLSLKVRGVPMIEGLDYCDDCGSTNIEQCQIEEWETLYENKYGIKYIDK